MPKDNLIDFSPPATGDSTFTLSAARSKNPVIYFHPKDNTPGCATEAQQFRNLHPIFKQVYGIAHSIFMPGNDVNLHHKNVRHKGK